MRPPNNSPERAIPAPPLASLAFPQSPGLRKAGTPMPPTISARNLAAHSPRPPRPSPHQTQTPHSRSPRARRLCGRPALGVRRQRCCRRFHHFPRHRLRPARRQLGLPHRPDLRCPRHATDRIRRQPRRQRPPRSPARCTPSPPASACRQAMPSPSSAPPATPASSPSPARSAGGAAIIISGTIAADRRSLEDPTLSASGGPCATPHTPRVAGPRDNTGTTAQQFQPVSGTYTGDLVTAEGENFSLSTTVTQLDQPDASGTYHIQGTARSLPWQYLPPCLRHRHRLRRLGRHPFSNLHRLDRCHHHYGNRLRVHRRPNPQPRQLVPHQRLRLR